MTHAYLYQAVRTPIGRRDGGLASVRPDDLLADTLAAVVKRAGIDAAAVEDVIAGCVTQTGDHAPAP